MTKQLFAVEAVAAGRICDQSAILVIESDRPPARIERASGDEIVTIGSESASVVVGPGDEVAGNRRGEGKPSAASDVRPRIIIGGRVAGAEPSLPGSDLGRCERGAVIDHVPSRSDPENESDDEGRDEIDKRAHRMARLVFAPDGRPRWREHER